MCALVLVSAAPCRHFICKDPVDPQNPEVCAEIVKKSPSQWLEYVGKCGTLSLPLLIDKGYICRMSETDDLTMKCLTNPEYQKLPGQKCTDASLCQGKVENGYCRGKKEGETCEHHLNCDVGLRCGTELKCEQASVEGEFCDSDTKLCQSYLYCKEGVCTKFGSVANDAPPGKGGEELCVSHHTDKNGVCREGPTLIGPNIVDSNDNKCVYSDAEENYATCGFHSEGKAICRPGDGEMMSEWKNVSGRL